MKVQLISSLVAVSSLVVSGSLLAESQSQTFNNNLHSKIMISPAQLYQVKGARTDLAIGFDSGSSEVKTDVAKQTTDVTATNFNAAGVYSMTDFGVKAGLDVKYGMQTTEPENSDKFDSTVTQIAPVALYSWDMLTVAAKYNFISRTTEIPAGEDLDTSYALFTPAVLVSQDVWEAGLVYTAPVSKADSNEEEVREPANVTLHGRYAVMPELKVGGSVAQLNWAAIEEDVLKDRTIVTANAEWALNQLALEGLVSYSTAAYDIDAAASIETIAQWGLEAAADYSLNPTTTVGGALGYTMGSDDVAGTELTNSDLAVSVRGNLMF